MYCDIVMAGGRAFALFRVSIKIGDLHLREEAVREEAPMQ